MDLSENNLVQEKKVLEEFWTSYWALFWNSIEEVNLTATKINQSFAVSFRNSLESVFRQLV